MSASKHKHTWWYVEHLIADLRADASLKYLLSLVHLHTNARRECAWTSQDTLAWEMNLSVPTVERLFREAKKMGVVGVRRVRTGKGQKEQFNEYWLNIKRLEELRANQPSPMTGAQGDQPSPVTGASEDDQPSNEAETTHQIEPDHPSNALRPPITPDGQGSKVKQVASKAGSKGEGATPRFVKFIEQLFTRLDDNRKDQVLNLIQNFLMYFRCDAIEKESVHFLELHRLYQKDTRALALHWKDRNDLWAYIVESFIPPTPEERAQLRVKWGIDKKPA